MTPVRLNTRLSLAFAAGLALAQTAICQIAFTEFAGPTGGLRAYLLGAGPDGNVWFSTDMLLTGQHIGKITPQGGMTLYPTASGRSEGEVCTGPDGNIWYPEYRTGNQIGRMAADGSSPTSFTCVGASFAHCIAVGPDQNLWFTNAYAGIGRLALSGAFNLIPIPSGVAYDVALGPDGNMWYTAGSAIGQVTMGGVVTEFPLGGGKLPIGICSGPDGNLWFAEHTGNAIGRITPQGSITEFALPRPSTHPVYIVAGPDGNLWFTTDGGHSVGKVTPQGVITEYLVPTLGRCQGIVLGPDGHLWFVEYTANKIVRVTLDPVVPSQATVKLGRVDTGNVSSLASRDNNALVVCKFIVPNQFVPPVNVEVEGDLPGPNLTALGFSLVSQVTSAGLFEVKLEMWNWPLGAWDPADFATAQVTVDSAAFQVNASGDPQRYVGANRRLRARYTVRQNGPGASALWCHIADQAVWISEP